jgi:MFS transporter, AAHS family, 4-hydroxybenzoate transporter
MERLTDIDIAGVIEQRANSRFLVGLVVISWVITFFDGFDSNLISFAAPYLRQQYQLDTIQIGKVFSIGLLGTLIGGLICGYIGDRFGRRPTIIAATAAFGILTMCFAFAKNYPSLFLLRLLNGIPLGGMLPLAWALNIEYASKRYRATIVTVIMIGYSIGTALGGPAATWFIPRLGWQSVFIGGGLLSVVSAVVLYLILPESIRLLTSRGKEQERVRAIIRRIAPELSVPAGSKFVVADEKTAGTEFRLSALFSGDLRWITPLIWVAYIFSSMAVYFIINWTPLVFEQLKYTRATAAAAASVNSLMGTVGGLLLMRHTDKHGAIAITVMPVMSVSLLLVASLTAIRDTPFLVLNALIGGFLIGGHFGMHSICGIFYPSAYRGNGAGWATSVAKIGSVAGPIIGGVVLSTRIPIRRIFAVLAICPAVFAFCIYVVGRAHSRSLGSEVLAGESEGRLMTGEDNIQSASSRG